MAVAAANHRLPKANQILPCRWQRIVRPRPTEEANLRGKRVVHATFIPVFARFGKAREGRGVGPGCTLTLAPDREASPARTSRDRNQSYHPIPGCVRGTNALRAADGSRSTPSARCSALVVVSRRCAPTPLPAKTCGDTASGVALGSWARSQRNSCTRKPARCWTRSSAGNLSK